MDTTIQKCNCIRDSDGIYCVFIITVREKNCFPSFSVGNTLNYYIMLNIIIMIYGGILSIMPNV